MGDVGWKAQWFYELRTNHQQHVDNIRDAQGIARAAVDLVKEGKKARIGSTKWPPWFEIVEVSPEDTVETVVQRIRENDERPDDEGDPAR